MSGKLMLYVEEDIIAYAKEYAKEHKLSVSKVVNNFLTLLKQERSKNDDIAPLTRSLKGILSDTRADIDDYHRHLEKKYL